MIYLKVFSVKQDPDFFREKQINKQTTKDILLIYLFYYMLYVSFKKQRGLN